MIKIENTDVYGFEAAIRGMRNPMLSHPRMDSVFSEFPVNMPDFLPITNKPIKSIGPNDMKLMRNLTKSGPDHGKFARMINVTVDITAPFYW